LASNDRFLFSAGFGENVSAVFALKFSYHAEKLCLPNSMTLKPVWHLCYQVERASHAPAVSSFGSVVRLIETQARVTVMFLQSPADTGLHSQPV
jgi:hypothetical protein